MLRKCFYTIEYLDDWEKFNETLPEKKEFYRHLNIKDITDADYVHTKRVCKDFEIKHLEQYHDLHVQSDALLLTCLKTLEICVVRYMNLILQNSFQLQD